jgi:cardiolipin synthase
MNETFGISLPLWGWSLLVIGAFALVAVIGALFLPDWPTPSYRADFHAEPGSDEFIGSAASLLNVPVLRGGTVALLQNGDAFFPEMLRAIRGARDTINFEVYIFEPDEIGRQFIDAFGERARAGVEVRLLVDGFGSFKLGTAARRELEQAGVRVERFRPLAFRHLVRIYRRTHRRAIVIDGRVAFTGGAAISKKWAGDVRNEHEWRDSMTRVTGPLVAGVQAAFALNWVYCTGEALAGPRFYPGAAAAPGPCGLSVISSPSESLQPIRLLLWLSFTGARRRLWISNSYFIPDEHLRRAVKERARAGVDVRIVVPGKHTDAVPVQWAGRSYYEELLEAGIRIFEYRAAMMHAKTAVIDDRWSIVGSANLDERSLELNEENVLAIADETFAAEITRGVLADIDRSREIRLDEWRRRSPVQRAFEALGKALIEQY